MKLAGAMLAAALGAVSTAAPAQTVSLYGLLDAGVEVLNHVGPSGSRLVRVPSTTGVLPSRIGFRGTEDLGSGLSAVYTLEMGLAPDQGTLGQGGRAFGRQAYVGLSSTSWGAVTAGRQYSMLFWSILDADIMGANLYGPGSLDPFLPNARTDNTVAWRGRFGGFSLGAAYSLGRDTVNAGPSIVGTNCAGEGTPDAQACRAWSAMVKYDSKPWGAALAYDRANGRAVGPAPDAVYGGLDRSDKHDARLMVNGYVNVGGARLGGGVIRRRNDGDAEKPKSDLWFVGASLPLTAPLTLDVGASTLRYGGAEHHDSRLVAARLRYAFSKRTMVYTQAGAIANDALAAVSVSGGATGGNPLPGRSQAGLNVGLQHVF